MSQHSTTHNQPADLPVRRTEVKTWLTEETMSPLGRELMRLADEIQASDEPALDEEDIEKELNKRRGGYAEDGD
jgi:hypothetical protein